MFCPFCRKSVAPIDLNAVASSRNIRLDVPSPLATPIGAPRLADVNRPWGVDDADVLSPTIYSTGGPPRAGPEYVNPLKAADAVSMEEDEVKMVAL